jgi:hypothetical protein
MYVTGAATPLELSAQLKRYTSADISSGIEQDVLHMAGSKDHGVPVEMSYRQIGALTTCGR